MDSAIADLTSELNGCTVFLAEVGSDLIGERDAVKRELQRSGIKVLPDKNMPDDLDAIKKFVRKELKKCNMSIHLVGSEDQEIEKSKSSLIDVQNKMASEHFNELEKLGQKSQPNLGKVVWISPEAGNASVKQRLLIEDLRKDDGAINDTDLLETSIEELKTFVLTKVNKGVEQLKKMNEFQGDEKKVIYLIHEQEDVSKCSKIKSLLKENGFNVISSDFSGNPDHIRAKHDDNLKRCDATLIYYGHENESWIKSKQKELQKSLGFGREKPLGPQAIIVENEQDDLLSRLGIDDNAIILKSKSNLSEEHFEPFLERLKE